MVERWLVLVAGDWVAWLKALEQDGNRQKAIRCKDPTCLPTGAICDRPVETLHFLAGLLHHHCARTAVFIDEMLLARLPRVLYSARAQRAVLGRQNAVEQSASR